MLTGLCPIKGINVPLLSEALQEKLIASVVARRRAWVGRRHRLHGEPDDWRRGGVRVEGGDPRGGRGGPGCGGDVDGRGRIRFGELAARRGTGGHRA